ncbi:5-oxoprolinase subunit PxpB [Psychroserpens sp. MEBiC05023]
MKFELTYRRFSERSILIEWPSIINKNILKDIINFKNCILNSNIKSIVQVNNAYNSILVIYEFAIDEINDEILLLKTQYANQVNISNHTLKRWKIPVCYNDEFALDLHEISKEKKLLKQDVITLHSETIYTVFFIGFLPGFLYLGGLDKRLQVSRKKSPRSYVKKGAVAIGGQQTGIYPNASPGGWNIIGNSPIEFFNPDKPFPCFAKSGDQIQFVPISMSNYNAIFAQVRKGVYKIESEVIDG